MLYKSTIFLYNEIGDIMNRKELLEKLKKELNLSEDKIEKINSIFENNMFIGKKNKENILDELMKKVNIDKNTAEKIYNKFMDIIGNGIKDKILNVFKK